MGKKSNPPPPPDYRAAAEETAASNQQAQTRADWTNRPTQITPWGRTDWTAQAGTDPSTGQPITQWTQTESLSPQLQRALDDQFAMQAGRSQIAGGMMNQLAQDFANPYDWSRMNAFGDPGQAGGLQAGQLQQGVNQAPQMTGAGQGMMAGVGGADAASRMRIEDAMMERMAPQHAQAQEALEGKLQNMGLTRGSEAWNREMQRLGDQQSRERFNALDRGLAEQQGQFGMGLQQGQFQNQAQQQAFGQNLQQGQQNFQNQLAVDQYGNQLRQQQFGMNQAANQQNWGQQMQNAQYQNQLRQQQIAEQIQQRGMTLNEMNALLSGQQVSSPQMPTFNASQSAGGANYNNAALNQYSAGMDAFNAQQQQQQGMMSGLGSLASMGMMFMSDARLKTDVVKVGMLPNGATVYDYTIDGRRERGVMAQELLKIRPDLVHVHRSGYLMVNYGGLQ